MCRSLIFSNFRYSFHTPKKNLNVEQPQNVQEEEILLKVIFHLFQELLLQYYSYKFHTSLIKWSKIFSTHQRVLDVTHFWQFLTF